MKIAVLVEGATERVFRDILINFLRSKLNTMPKIRFITHDGRIPKEDKLKKVVSNLLAEYDTVIALTDVYTGTEDFADANDAKTKMNEWVGDSTNFYAHAAQYDFEAWLLPYWPTIQNMAGHNKKAPSGSPELVNHSNPPSYRIKEIFELGKKRSYSKTRDAKRILERNNLNIAIDACPELKAFVNTIITRSGGLKLV